MRVLYYIFFYFATISIWIAIIESLILLVGAVKFYQKELNADPELAFNPNDLTGLPTVTVMVPAHNEARVIETTIRHILQLNYPKEKLEVLIVNDNSTDNSVEVLARVQAENPTANLRVLTIDDKNIGGGKSKALNYGMHFVSNEYLAIYDADAAPERNALLLLVRKILESPDHGAAFGRNKARNRNRNLLTKFINLELIVSQRILHTGKWELFKIGQIPGTNFLIKKALLDEIGGWDVLAMTEDTELSFQIMMRGYNIALESRSEAYQQEPEKLSVYLRQRERWAKGNLYVATKNLRNIFSKDNWQLRLETLYYMSTYFWFLFAILISDILIVIAIIVGIMNLFGAQLLFPIDLSFQTYVVFTYSWALMYVIYVLQINLAASTDFGQATKENFVLSCISYFTYAQLFVYISLKSIISSFLDIVLGRNQKWYKTERF